MNRLEKLRSDMHDAGREARISGEDEMGACLEVLDEFCWEYEVVEVFDVRHTGEPNDHWLAMPDSVQHEPDFVWGDKEVVTPLAILVPRKQEPTLLEAAEKLEGLVREVAEAQFKTEILSACDAVAAAAKKEREHE